MAIREVDRNRPKFSIVIPTYRRERQLLTVVAAVAVQADSPDMGAECEILIVDNSPEGSAREGLADFAGRACYVHEPQTGLANARNAGIRAARGDHVIFIDDDQMPDPGWLSAFRRLADRGADACFGSISAEFEIHPDAALADTAVAMFSRKLPAEEGDDVSRFRAFLGTGNSMFRVAACFPDNQPFDPRFNEGGEDIWLLRQLVEDRGIRLLWSKAAHVSEIVPRSRVEPEFLWRRRFRNGQLRCIVEYAEGGLVSILRVSMWMAVGLAQVFIFGITAVAARAAGAPKATNYSMKAAGGLGKMLWWRRAAR